jgi:amino acid adenylation domain-containing protein
MGVGTRSGLLSPSRLALLDALRKDDPDRGRRHAPPVVPVARGREVPLSFAELRLWFLYQLDPQSPVYNVSGNIWFSGHLDIDALMRSVNEMTRRHETLRTTFVEIDGTPTKVIDPSREVDLPCVDLRALDEAEVESEVHRLSTEEVLAPFDLARGPLLRMKWLRVRDEENLVLFTKHHIISDGWSVGGFLHEMATLYAAYSSGRPSPLPELPIQHSDYTVWQRNWLQGEVLEERLAFWRRQLAGAPALLELPTDRPRPAVQSHRGGWKTFSLPLDLSRAVKAFGRRHDLTLFMTLLAGFYALLHRYSGQDDIVVGSPISNRNRVETEALLGVIFNTLVLRVSLEGDPTFRELVRRVREAALGAYAHQDLPFEQLVEALQPERSLSHSPIFQVMFVLQNSPMPEFALPNVTMRKYDFHPQTAKYELTWTIDEKDPFVHEKDQPLTGSVEYSTDLFDRATIDRMVEHYETLLAAALAGPDLRVSQLPLLPPAERRRVLDAWNDTARPAEYAASIPDLLRAQLARTPEALALRCGDRAVSFRELHARADAVARCLRERGVGAESTVAICLERTPELVVAMLGVLSTGAAYVPLDPAYPRDRIAFVLDDARVALILTDTASMSVLPDTPLARLRVDEPWSAAGGGMLAPPAICPDALAYVIYTSGSTGRPKGVAISHRNAVNFLTWARDTFPEPERAGMLAATSVCFDLSIFEIFLPLSFGGTVVLARNVLELPQAAGAGEVTLVNTVPSALAELLRQGPLPPSVRVVNLAGERLPAELVQEIGARNSGVRVLNLYGPSETTTYSTAAVLDPACAAGPPIGSPIANTRTYVLDARGEPSPIGVPGELFIGGAGVARGYLERPDLTAERFVPDPFGLEPGARLYRTGDLVRWRADGSLEFLGRSDHQVKLRGFRIEPGEIEHVLGQHPAVLEAVVVTRAERPDDVRLVAYVVVDEASTPPDLRAFVRERLPEYMVPNVVVCLPELPRTPNGKVDRGRLPDPAPAVSPGSGSRPLDGPYERTLADIWCDVLGVEGVGAADNFFSLGGHSLLAMRVVSRLRRELGIELPVRALFERPVLEDLAAAVDRQASAATAPARESIRPADRSGPVPLSSTQRRLWFLDRLNPGSTAYTIPAALRLRGALDLPALRRSLDAIVERHEILRTTFPVSNGEPVQQVGPRASLPMRVDDLRHVASADRQAEILRRARAAAAIPFQLDRGPLVRATLLVLDDTDHVLIVTMHHIVSDGWSIGIFLRELLASHDAFASGGEPEMVPLPIQFADFALWQHARLSGSELDRQVAYWRARLAGAPALLALSTDRPRPAVESHRGDRRPIVVPAPLRAALVSAGQRKGATPFMTLLAAWQALLSRYTGQPDIVVGSPIAGRTMHETEPLIGCFVNTLPLRTDVSGDPTFAELLGRVRDTTLEAYEHDDVPFEHLVEALQPRRSLSHAPVFQVMFVLQNTPMPGRTGRMLDVESIELPGDTSKFDLTLALVETPAALHGTLEYATDLFDRQTIDAMTVDYLALLSAVAASPDAPISTLMPDVTWLTGRARTAADAIAAPGAARSPDTATAEELAIAAIWQDVLGVPQVRPDEDFFALGGHSLLAVRMLLRIRDSLHVDVELRQFFAQPTVAGLAALVACGGREPRPATPVARSPLVRLHGGSDARRCYCVHPGGGQVFWYRALASRLGTDVTVDGLEARGLDGAQPPHVRIEAMAASYLDAIADAEPREPYALVGWSLGGLVALEMAQQLAALGREVDALVLLDTRLVGDRPAHVDESMLLARFVRDLAALAGQPPPLLPALEGLGAEEQLAAVVDCSVEAGLWPRAAGADRLRRQYDVFRANARAMLAYDAGAYAAGPIWYFEAEASAGASGPWRGIAAGGLVLRTVPGDHYTMLRPPHVDVLAAGLRECLGVAT